MRTLLLTALFALSIPAWAEPIRLQDNAPEHHVVVAGDTLWSLSETFLKDPWQWPDAWNLSPEAMKNPQLIFPGDVVRLVQDGAGNFQFKLEPGPRLGTTVKLSPRAYSEPIVIKETGISSIPEAAIAHLLSRSSVGEPSDLENAPRIFGSVDARVLFGLNDTVYASAGEPDVVDWRIVRLGQPIKSPGNPKEVLAYELVHVGEGKTVQAGNPQRLRITRADQEILERDRLLPAWKQEPMQYVPHAPSQPISARVATTLGGTLHAGTWMTVVLDKGVRDGLEQGHVLALFRAGRSVADPRCRRADKLAFLAGGEGHARDCRANSDDQSRVPDSRSGLAFVYRVFDKVSYALVMKSEEQVTPGDSARNP